MKRIRITVIRKACYRDLMERYENPLDHPCDLSVGQCFECDGLSRPEGLCESAWQSLSPFVMALAHGATGLYDGWMKNPASAMLSCNDGFRPVSFLVEALDEPTPDGQAPGKQTPDGGEPAARKEPADPTPGSGEPAARKEPADPTPGNEMPAGKEPDRPETRSGNRSETLRSNASPTDAAPSASDAARHRGRPAAATPATSATPAAVPAAAPANPETRPHEKTES
ncbi:TIGR04076 family protein [Alistipes sp. An31A]|uniref:TIGR04076 family protein n=1 Tax=Alistipes sp. An31A TaxID=1965631 RepID=UPI000B3A60F7